MVKLKMFIGSNENNNENGVFLFTSNFPYIHGLWSLVYF